LLPHHWPLLTIRRELQRRVQGSHVERGHVASGDCNAAAPYPAVHYTPLVVLSAIIISAMLRLIDYHVVLHPWQVDKVDFCFCISAYLGVVFGSVKIGLVVAVSISALRALLFITRPRTTVLSSATSQLHGLPEDGPVRHGAGHAGGARPARRRAHLLRQRQLPAGESLAGRDGLNSEALNIIDMNTRLYSVSDCTS